MLSKLINKLKRKQVTTIVFLDSEDIRNLMNAAWGDEQPETFTHIPVKKKDYKKHVKEFKR